jgi:small subunit ribosomal protein S7
MPRRGRIEKHEIRPDIRYGSVLVSQLINKVMLCGKKSTASGIVYDAFAMIEERMHRNGLEVFEQAVKNATPLIEVKPRRVGGATYQVPVEIRSDRRVSLALRWLISASRSRPGHTMAEKLAGELMDAARNTGTTVKRREDTHKMAEANRAFAHYRW